MRPSARRATFRILALMAGLAAARSQETVTPPPATTAPAPPPAATTPPAASTPTPTPTIDDGDETGGTPVETPAGAPIDILTLRPGQTVVRATYRVIGAGAAAPLPSGAEADFLATLAAAGGGALPLSTLAVLRVAPAYVPLRAAAASRRLLAEADASTVKGAPLAGVADVLVQANASESASPPPAVQAAYDALRAVAYSGTLQSGLRAAGWPWAVVLTGAVAAVPGDPWPEPDDWCRQRLGGSCLDGSGLSAAGAKGLIAAGVILVLVAATLALVAADRRRAATGGRGGGMSAMVTGTVPGGVGSGGGGGRGGGVPAGAIASVSTTAARPGEDKRVEAV